MHTVLSKPGWSILGSCVLETMKPTAGAGYNTLPQGHPRTRVVHRFSYLPVTSCANWMGSRSAVQGACLERSPRRDEVRTERVNPESARAPMADRVNLSIPTT